MDSCVRSRAMTMSPDCLLGVRPLGTLTYYLGNCDQSIPNVTKLRGGRAGT